MFGILEICNRDLMRAPGTLDRLIIDEFRSNPWACGKRSWASADARGFPSHRETARRSESGESAPESHRACRQDIDVRSPDRRPRRNADRIRSHAIAPSVPGG